MPTLTDDSIQTTSAGFLFPAAETWTFAPGILVSSTANAGVYCDYNDATLINHGTILSALPTPTTGLGSALVVEADNFSLTNAGDGFILGYIFGMSLAGPRATITNHGQIESFDFAINCSPALMNLYVDNTGIIRGREFGITASMAGGTIRNSGLIEGTRSTAIESHASGHGLTIINESGGTIRGDRAVGNFGNSGLSLINRGTIVGEIYFGSDAADVVVNGGSIVGRVFLGDGADRFNGTGGRSGIVLGGNGNDTLGGGAVADRLDGGLDADTLTGRGGSDKFIFSTGLGPGNVDRIVDFAVNVDKILLGDNVFHLNPSGVLAAAAFHVGGQAADASDRIVYNAATGALFYDHDGRGGDAQVKFAQLTPHLGLDNADFLILPVK